MPSPVLLKQTVAMNTQDVVDPTNTQALVCKNELSLSVLTNLDLLVHGTHHFAFVGKLLRNRFDGASDDAKGRRAHFRQAGSPWLKPLLPR